MATTFELAVTTPERLLFREQATEAQIPCLNGYIGVLPDHAPLLSELGAGKLTFSVGGRTEVMAIAGGFVEVLDNHVRVLADAAERAAEIDLAEAQEQLRRAQERIAAHDPPSLEIDEALRGLMHAQARVDAAQSR